MKRTRQVSAEEAGAWLKANPGKHVTDKTGFNWYIYPTELMAPYTVTEDDDEHFSKQRDELEKWLKEKRIQKDMEDFYVKPEDPYHRNTIPIEVQKAEKKKGYQWKNCAIKNNRADWYLLRRVNGKNGKLLAWWTGVSDKWQLINGDARFELYDPENWEFLELEE